MTVFLTCVYLIIGVITAFLLYTSLPAINQDNHVDMPETGFETFTIACVIAATWPFWLGLIVYERFWRSKDLSN